MKMTDQEVLASIGREITEARGYDADELQWNRRKSLRYYFGRLRGDEVEGRAIVQSLDVADAVNNIMAQLSPMMKATTCEFPPTSEEDEDQAQLESDFCMWIAEQSNAYEQFSNAAFDALLQSNGWIKCYVDEVTRTWVDDHEGIDPMMLAEILAPVEPKDMVEPQGQPVEAEDGTLSLSVKHTITQRALKVEAVAPEYMLFAAGHLSQQIQDIRFLGEKKLLTRSELLESGISKAVVDNLPAVDYETFEAATERQFGYDDKRSGEERSTDVIDVYDCYVHMDIDGDGIAELWRVRVAGYEASILLDKEPAKFIPYCTGSALPLPHRLTGTSMFDLLRHVQDAKTMTMRQLIDNQNVANNSRIGAVEGEVNMQDVLESKPGGVIRMRSPGAITAVPFNDAGQSCLQTLAYLDQVRSERGAGSIDMNSGQMQIAGTSATAAMNEYGHKEKVATFYCRNIVESLVRGTYLLVHQALRCYYDGDMSAKLHGKWAQTNPKQWPIRRDIRVVAGLSATERREKSQSLAMNLQYQQMALQAGMDGVLVTPSKLHACIADWLRSTDLRDIESYWVDPDSEEGQAAMKNKSEQAQAATEKQEKLEQRLIDQQQELDRWKHQTELDYKYFDSRLDAEVKEAEMTADGVIEIERIHATDPKEQDNAA